MPEPINPNPEGVNPGGATSGDPQFQSQQPAQQGGKFNELKQKKGFKSEEDLATAYEEVEKSKSRYENVHGKVKQQIEAAGYVLDEDGTIRPKEAAPYPTHTPGYPQPGQPQQQPYPQQQQEAVYDPYTGMPITDPVALQLSRIPMGQREAFIFNALLEQREKQQSASYQAESEVLSKPEAKGFEEDVKKVMMAIPLQQRANKQSWEDALLRVKGMRYDQAMRNAQQQGVEQFINKESLQPVPGVPGGGSGGKLTPEQRQRYLYWRQRDPEMFKNEDDFLRAESANYGR